jgi:hypothetical protein
MKPFTAGLRMATHRQSHVTASPLVRQLHRAATAARFPVPLGVESAYRYVERDWLSTGGPTLLSEIPPSRDPDSRSLPGVKTLLDRVRTQQRLSTLSARREAS